MASAAEGAITLSEAENITTTVDGLRMSFRDHRFDRTVDALPGETQEPHRPERSG
jgi:hypothetical protein